MFAPRLVASLILLQTLLFKFGVGGQAYLAESQELFSNLTQSLLGSAKYEAFARIGTGILEMLTAILMLTPSKAWIGGLLGIALMTGAILSHLLIIGVSINDDGGQLMFMAAVVLICSLKVTYDEKEEISAFLKRST